jgi:putative RecB family exonuclease
MPIYSHSRLATFENCPLKYKFQYIDKLKKPEEVTVEAFLGSRVHAVLEKLYKEQFFEKPNTLDDLIAFYQSAWEKNWTPQVRIVRKGLTQQHYFNYGVKCIRNYYDQYAPFDQSQTLATEAHIAFPLDAKGNYQLQGYIDRLSKRSDGTYEIHDYKTSQKLPSQHEADADRQLALYQIGVATRWNDVGPVDLLWHYVGFKTTIRSERKPQQLVQLKENTVRLIERIEAEKDFQPRKSFLCNWCEYKPDCPLWSHPVKVQSLPAPKFKKDEGVKLANSYVETHRTIQELSAKLDEIRQQLVAYSAQHNATVIQGSERSVSIKQGERTAFLAKGDLQRDRLERTLKRIRKWEEVAELSTAKLLHKLHDQSWPPRLLTLLKKFTHSEPTESLRIIKSATDNTQK